MGAFDLLGIECHCVVDYRIVVSFKEVVFVLNLVSHILHMLIEGDLLILTPLLLHSLVTFSNKY